MAYYAYITTKIQKDQRKHFEITNRPYFSFDRYELAIKKGIGDSITALQIIIHFKNVGNVLLVYKIEEFAFAVNGINGKNRELLNNGGPVYPQMNSTFYFPLEDCFNTFSLEKTNEASFSYRLSYKIPGNSQVYKSERVIKFDFDINIQAGQPFNGVYEVVNET